MTLLIHDNSSNALLGLHGNPRQTVHLAVERSRLIGAHQLLFDGLVQAVQQLFLVQEVHLVRDDKTKTARNHDQYATAGTNKSQHACMYVVQRRSFALFYTDEECTSLSLSLLSLDKYSCRTSSVTESKPKIREVTYVQQSRPSSP